MNQQGNRGDMWKIHARFRYKDPFLDKVYGSVCTKFQVFVVFRLARKRETNTLIHNFTHIQVKLGTSLTE